MTWLAWRQFRGQFLVAALLRVINAPSLQQARAAKEILLNELGVIYHKPGASDRVASASGDTDRSLNGDTNFLALHEMVYLGRP